MERLKKIVTQIASTPDHRLPELPLLHRSLLPILSLTSSLYRLSLSIRRRLYLSGLLHQHRLPVPVISVGNLTWGGNGKTPMTEFIARVMDEAGIPPLILSRGYAGGDEAKMLQRHLVGSSARIGIGADRAATAAAMFRRYGYMEFQHNSSLETRRYSNKFRTGSSDEKVGIVILDDGMQHWSLFRNVDIVMLNGLMPCGNNHLVPRGPLREPLSALLRVDILVIHHADLVSDTQLKRLVSSMQEFSANIPIFFSRLAPSHFFEARNSNFRLPLTVVQNLVTLCVSAIGFPDAFIQGIEKIGPLHVDRLDFSDHHCIHGDEVNMIRKKVKELENKLGARTVVVVTEKDYDRDPNILIELDEVLVLCSSFQIMPFKDTTEENFVMTLKSCLISEMK